MPMIAFDLSPEGEAKLIVEDGRCTRWKRRPGAVIVRGVWLVSVRCPRMA
jgi:hypothetical protein